MHAHISDYVRCSVELLNAVPGKRWLMNLISVTSARKQFTLFSIIKVSSSYIASQEALEKLEKSMRSPIFRLRRTVHEKQKDPNCVKDYDSSPWKYEAVQFSKSCKILIRILCHPPFPPDPAGTDFLKYIPQFSYENYHLYNQNVAYKLCLQKQWCRLISPLFKSKNWIVFSNTCNYMTLM
jgi:hypothetical protein